MQLRPTAPNHVWLTPARAPYGGAGDTASDGLALAGRFRRHADALLSHNRSPLCSRLMQDAASDLEASGITADLFLDVPVPPGSVPQLRLLSALHHLVLAGRAPALAAFYPSVGGQLPPEDCWPAALATIEEHRDWIRERLHCPVQTNEPGRSAVLFSALLWLTARHGLPIRLLEIGASAGVNLIPDRYCYVVNGAELGDANSPVRFYDPWQPGPAIDLGAAARELQITVRAGCDRSPLDPTDPEDQVALLSYIWPDELERFERLKAAIALAASQRVPVTAQSASRWLTDMLSKPAGGALTVIWQSVFWQYVDEKERAAIEDTIGHDAAGDPEVVWLSMEPGNDHIAGMRLGCRNTASQSEQPLARCDDHGPPVVWAQARAGPDAG